MVASRFTATIAVRKDTCEQNVGIEADNKFKR
jgi:hypothetical protein